MDDKPVKYFYEGECINIRRYKEYPPSPIPLPLPQEIKVRSTIEFKIEDRTSPLGVQIEVDGKYELGQKFAMEIYIVP